MVFYYFLNDFILRHLTNSNKLVIEKFIQALFVQTVSAIVAVIHAINGGNYETK